MRLCLELDFMCELVASHEQRTDCVEGVTRPGRKRAGASGKRSWMLVSAVVALVLGCYAFFILASRDAHRENRSSDEALTTDFFSHEAKFGELVQMLATDHPSPAAGRATGIGLATVAGADKSGARLRMYEALLRQISVVGIRYFPDSGKLVLVPDGQQSLEQPSRTYVYMPRARTQPWARHYGYSWHGPGVYTLTADRPLAGSWFIHHDTTIEVAISPY